VESRNKILLSRWRIARKVKKGDVCVRLLSTSIQESKAVPSLATRIKKKYTDSSGLFLFDGVLWA